MGKEIPFLSAEDLHSRADPARMVGAMEEALRAMAAGGLAVVPRAHLSVNSTTLLSMPSANQDLFCVKLVTVNPDNPNRGLPLTQGVAVLFSVETGAPLFLLDAAALTAQRTGAVAAVGIRHLTPPDLSSLGIVGTGVQAAWTIIQTRAVRPIAEVFCAARDSQSFDPFRATLSRFAPEVTVNACRDAQEMLENSQCVIAATPSRTPVLPNVAEHLQGKTFVSIGSFRPDMQELPDAAYRLAEAIVVDSPQAITEAGDVINAVRNGFAPEHRIVLLSELVSGRVKPPPGPTRILKTVGHAAFDLFAARELLAFEQ